MNTQRENQRVPMPGHTQSKDGKSHAGRTDAGNTPIEIRNLSGGADARLKAWVRERLGRQLGKFAPQIERIDVRFGDVNGHKGGLDRRVMVHVVLSALPPVIVEITGGTDREAFDVAAGRAERATRRTLEKHGFSTGHKKRDRPDKSASIEGMAMSDGQGELHSEILESELGDREPLYGKRAGSTEDQLMLLQQRPEKVRRDMPVDTSMQGTGANDRKAGYGHTGKRNTKLNNAGMAYALEDSTDGRPSRKSTRRSSNRTKPASGLTIKTKSSVLSPKSIAGRSVSRGH